MKKQILTLIIGILIGGIIMAAVFLIFKGNTGSQGSRVNRGEMPFTDESFLNMENGEFSLTEEESNQNTDDISNNIEE